MAVEIAASVTMPHTDSVKYHLVEAEEVSRPNASNDFERSSKQFRKGKANWKQHNTELGPSAYYSKEHYSSKHEQRPYRCSRRSNRSRAYNPAYKNQRWGMDDSYYQNEQGEYTPHGIYQNGVFVPNPDVRITAQWAKQQIEFYFSPENLVRDMFLRQHMDVDGFVPLAFVGSFQAVYSLHQDYPSLLEAMQCSEVLEFDQENEKIRLRHGWEKWLWPNPDGSYGVPPYVKMNLYSLDPEAGEWGHVQQEYPQKFASYGAHYAAPAY
uniref:Uncharacterized protein AlNc14C48G3858 n=1 Tax=Albugo laibachii Nc14 TaxID=890382 RepID=F0WB01_9STRA|nr:conserved hypothetical protein [Albugo laibachii Nc14]CCA18404.1 conserved hypothetical protein [Albugo laibachii Nc14]|eukprot:CCA18404.1 conserved hypothetical protein [Albugo laibachii Nc14]